MNRPLLSDEPRTAKRIAAEWEQSYGERQREGEDPLDLLALVLASAAWVVAVAFALGSLVLYWRG